MNPFEEKISPLAESRGFPRALWRFSRSGGGVGLWATIDVAILCPRKSTILPLSALGEECG